MGEEAYHEEFVIFENTDAKTRQAFGLVLRQVYGDHEVYLGLDKAELDKAWGQWWVDPERLYNLTQDDLWRLHGAIEQMLWARCEKCDVPVDGSKGAPGDELACDDCVDGVHR